MGATVPLSWLIISTTLLLLGAGCAVGYLLRGFRSTPPPKRTRSPATTQEDSENLSDRVREKGEQLQLLSELEKINSTVSKLNAREVMRQRRGATRSDEAPPPGTSKAELLRFYGMSGKVGPEFAREQLKRERSN